MEDLTMFVDGERAQSGCFVGWMGEASEVVVAAVLLLLRCEGDAEVGVEVTR